MKRVKPTYLHYYKLATQYPSFTDIKEIKGVMDFCPILLTYVPLHLSIVPTLFHFNLKETADSNGQYAIPCDVTDSRYLLNFHGES
jgi:hypothetical protein